MTPLSGSSDIPALKDSPELPQREISSLKARQGQALPIIQPLWLHQEFGTVQVGTPGLGTRLSKAKKEQTGPLNLLQTALQKPFLFPERLANLEQAFESGWILKLAELGGLLSIHFSWYLRLWSLKIKQTRGADGLENSWF